jgi:aspartate kinase
MAQEFDIPLIIKNTYSDNEGTYIKAMDAQFIHDRKKLFNKGIIISLTYKKNRAQLIITLEDSKRDLGSLIEKIALENINLDIINFLPSKKILTIDMRDKDKLVNLLEKENFDYEIIKNCCKLSILGYKIKDNPEIIARIIKALSSENISILQISDPNNTFSCLIKEEDTNKALAILHKEFKLHD